MSRGSRCKKRPCRICRRWFVPNARVKDRQMTCGDPGCKREWHRRKCQEWNRANRDYFRANYLPLRFVQEVIGVQHLLIIEYLAQLLMRRFQEVLRGQLVGNTGQLKQLPRMGFSRGDRL